MQDDQGHRKTRRGGAVKEGFSEGCGNVQGCAGGVTLCGTVVGREGGGSKAGFTAEKSVERKVIAEQTGKCDTGLRAAAPCKRRMLKGRGGVGRDAVRKRNDRVE